MFGYTEIAASPVFRGFPSLDNQFAFLLATRGLVGVLAWLCLVVVPPTLAVLRPLKQLPGRRFVILVALAILMLGMGVGFFALFTVYLYATLGLCWGSMVGGSPAPARRDVSAVSPGPSLKSPRHGNGVAR
jgi:O-antigen ligase